MTRNAASTAAQKLEKQGAEIVIGDLNDRSSLEVAMANAYGVFSVQDYWQKGVGFAGEIQQGKNLADAAKKSRIQHYVQSSMAEGADFQGVKHFESKVAIEAYIAELDLPRTAIGTVYFVDNILDRKMGGSMTFPTLAGSLRADLPFHLLAIDDLGGVVATVFQDRDRFLGQKIDVASDCMTIAQMKTIYQKVSGKRPKSWQIPAWLLKLLNREFAAQLQWQNQPGWTFAIDRVKEIYPNLTSFEQFLERHQVTNL